mgnify:CR=1 FL=1
MSHSLRETSYQGVFTYQHGNTVQSMRISHSVDGQTETEEVTHLSGAGARIVRKDHPLDCVHPGHRLVRTSELYAQTDAGCGVAEHYSLKTAGLNRIAGRQAVTINILPLDMYRYGYQIALDSETGLLLKTQTMAQDGKILERFQFADLSIGPVDELNGATEGVHHASHSHADAASGAASTGSELPWHIGWVPDGFVQTDGDNGSVFDKTFTDGLAVFTVFLETMPKLAAPGEGRARQGGTTAYTRGMALDRQAVLVTVLGEVPINTARMVADSIRWSSLHAD